MSIDDVKNEFNSLLAKYGAENTYLVIYGNVIKISDALFDYAAEIVNAVDDIRLYDGNIEEVVVEESFLPYLLINSKETNLISNKKFFSDDYFVNRTIQLRACFSNYKKRKKIATIAEIIKDYALKILGG